MQLTSQVLKAQDNLTSVLGLLAEHLDSHELVNFECCSPEGMVCFARLQPMHHRHDAPCPPSLPAVGSDHLHR